MSIESGERNEQLFDDYEYELDLLQKAGESDWLDVAIARVGVLESMSGGIIYPCQNSKTEPFVNALVDYSIERKQTVIGGETSVRLDMQDGVELLSVLYDGSQQYNQSALAAELGVALASSDQPEFAIEIVNRDEIISDEHKDQVMLAIAENYARHAEYGQAFDYLEWAFAVGNGINETNIVAFNKAFQAIIDDKNGV